MTEGRGGDDKRECGNNEIPDLVMAVFIPFILIPMTDREQA